MTQQIPVVMGDHKIDLIDAEHDNKKGIEKAEIGRKIIPMTQDQVFGYPDGARQEQQGIGNVLPCPEESPDPELPEDKDPFQERIDIYHICVTGLLDFDQIAAYQLCGKPG